MILCYGVVPLRRLRGHWQLYLVERGEGFWELPKGHKEEGESDLQAAMRELTEETGLVFVKLLKKDPLKLSYSFIKNGKKEEKEVLYFLAEVEGKGSFDGLECIDGGWYGLEEAVAKATYHSSKKLIEQVFLELS